MGQAIEQRGGHLRIAEHIRPLGEAEVGGDDPTGVLVYSLPMMWNSKAPTCENSRLELPEFNGGAG
jgi:hypothetical protein